jgi:cell division protein FtsN
VADSKQKSPWIWISLLLIIGLFIAFILFLDQKIVKGSHKPDAVNPQQDSRGEPVFDFYTVLPERGVDIPSSPRPTDSVKPQKDDKKNNLSSQASYVLQAGSFARAQDAERRKAELAFLGLESSVREASVGGKVYHRVELGPFADDGRFSSIKNQLIENDINYIAKSIR